MPSLILSKYRYLLYRTMELLSNAIDAVQKRFPDVADVQKHMLVAEAGMQFGRQHTAGQPGADQYQSAFLEFFQGCHGIAVHAFLVEIGATRRDVDEGVIPEKWTQSTKARRTNNHKRYSRNSSKNRLNVSDVLDPETIFAPVEPPQSVPMNIAGNLAVEMG